jgi:histone deacetylase complex regulatory component SIN3
MKRQFPIVGKGPAAGYMEKVRYALGGRPVDYISFLEAMWLYTAGELTIREAFARLTKSLEGNVDLIRNFEHFLPGCLQIVEFQDSQPRFKLLLASHVIPPPVKKAVADKQQEDEAVNFVAKVKQRFLHTPEVYLTFLRILRSLKQEGFDEQAIGRAQVGMFTLFKNHPDLIEHFHYFLTEKPSSTSNHDENLPENSVAIPVFVGCTQEKRSIKNEAPRAQNHNNSTTTSMLTAAPVPSSGTSSQDENAHNYLKKIKSSFEDSPSTYLIFLGLMKQYKEKKLNTQAVILQLLRLFEGHDDLILGFNQFLPPGYDMANFSENVPPAVIQK